MTRAANPPGEVRLCLRPVEPAARARKMRTEMPESTLDASEQDLARKLRKQAAEWKTMRAPL